MRKGRHKSCRRYQDEATRFSECGRTAYICLAVDRIDYEYARSVAKQLAENSDLTETAESFLEAYLSNKLSEDGPYDGWHAPPEIKALYKEYAKRLKRKRTPSDLYDYDYDIPF